MPCKVFSIVLRTVLQIVVDNTSKSVEFLGLLGTTNLSSVFLHQI